jgi:hypothetical protein
MTYLTKKTADALCTVITLGFAGQMEANGQPVTFEYEQDRDAGDHEVVQAAFEELGVRINVRQSLPQNLFPYILGANLPQNRLDAFIVDLTRYINTINNMFNEANGQANPPRGAYIGVQFFVNQAGNIAGDPNIYGPSALSLHLPVYRTITFAEGQAIGIAYYNARKSTNDATRAVIQGLMNVNVHQLEFDTDYQAGHIFGSGHGMIRAMVNSVTPPVNCESVFAEIALGNNTTKVSSCVPCAIFMHSFGYPASSIHLGRGDNWRIPDTPGDEVLTNWKNTIVNCYTSGLDIYNPLVDAANNIRLDDMAAILITERNDGVQDILPGIPDLFLEALTFEDSFIQRIKNTRFP